MKGKINKLGYLEIERAGKLVRQACPFCDVGGCGDWCPQFGEPFELSPGVEGSATGIDICHGRYLSFSEFTDERGNQ
jgi:hypothetical protein